MDERINSDQLVDTGGFKKSGNYGCPHIVKYVAWLIVVTVITSSTAVIVHYALYHDIIRNFFWLTAYINFFFICVFATEPLRIFSLSVIDSIFFKNRPVLIKRKVPPSLFKNPTDLVKKNKIMKYRRYNSNLYNPLPLYKQQIYLRDVTYNLELKRMTTDIFVYAVFVTTALYMGLMTKPTLGFYSNEMVSALILKETQENSVSFNEVKTDEMLFKYLNETLFPALLRNSESGLGQQMNETLRRRRRRRGSEDSAAKDLKPPLQRVEKSQTLDESNTVLADDEADKIKLRTGWTSNPNFKLMGKPRLRQIRVKKSSCKEIINATTRNVECSQELGFFNEETRDFSVKWGPLPLEGAPESEPSPWCHQSAWKTGTLPIFGKFALYPPGGYVAELERNLEDARMDLQSLNTLQWIDTRTRVVFVEFTVYCANTNQFSIVTLMVEKSATGYMYTSHKIDTGRFLFWSEFSPLITSLFFSMPLFSFLLRESLRTYMTSFKQYISRALGTLDFLIISLSVLSLILTFLRSIYVAHLIKELGMDESNKFVSFVFASFWYSWSDYVEALLVFLVPFKIFSLLSIKASFFKHRIALKYSCNYFISFLHQKLKIITALAILFGVIFICYCIQFENLGNAFITLVAGAVGLDDVSQMAILSETHWIFAPLFFWAFVVLICLLLLNMFTAVLCYYYNKIQHVSPSVHYHLFEYIKYFLTLGRQKQLFVLKEEKTVHKETDLDIMRLKGGGNKTAKCEKKMKAKHKKGKSKKKGKVKKKTVETPEVDDRESTNISLRNFVTQKPLDATKYCDLTESRALALKNLIAGFLVDDENYKSVARENAIKALFLSFITDETKLDEQTGKYFLGYDKTDISVFKKETLFRMKETVENLGRERQWIVEDDICHDEVLRKNNLAVLERKLSHLTYLVDDD